MAQQSSAFGYANTASGYRSSALGHHSKAYTDYSVALGSYALAGNQKQEFDAEGHLIDVPGDAVSAIAIGACDEFSWTEARAKYSIAIGYHVIADAENALAIGSNTNAGFANSVALGSNSVTSAMNTISVGYSGGERRITNVAAGTADTDAANYGQVKNKADKATTLAGYGVGKGCERERLKICPCTLSHCIVLYVDEEIWRKVEAV